MRLHKHTISIYFNREHRKGSRLSSWNRPAESCLCQVISAVCRTCKIRGYDENSGTGLAKSPCGEPALDRGRPIAMNATCLIVDHHVFTTQLEVVYSYGSPTKDSNLKFWKVSPALNWALLRLYLIYLFFPRISRACCARLQVFPEKVVPPTQPNPTQRPYLTGKTPRIPTVPTAVSAAHGGDLRYVKLEVQRSTERVQVTLVWNAASLEEARRR